MTVQAQYPANLLLLNRAETERNSKEMEMNFSPLPLIQQSPVFFSSSNGGNVSTRKRGREADAAAAGLPQPMATPQQQQLSFFSLQATHAGFLAPAMLGLAQLQSSAAPLVSTGLCLAVDEQDQNRNQREQPNRLRSAFFSEELGAQINQQKEEFEQFLITQGEQLRRAIVERRKRLYRCLLAAAEEMMGRKLCEKAAEAERAVHRSAELEDRLDRLRRESMAWQAKAMAEQAAAAALHVQLQQAAAAAAEAPAGGGCCGESPTRDAESAYNDPDRKETVDRPCRSCQRRPASVVLLPCRHLCLCDACDSAGAAGDGCPACGCFRTGSLEVSQS